MSGPIGAKPDNLEIRLLAVERKPPDRAGSPAARGSCSGDIRWCQRTADGLGQYCLLNQVKATAEADKLCFPLYGLTAGFMGIAEKIYEVVKDLTDRQAAEILGFAENVKARSATVVPAQRRVDLALFRLYRGRYDGRKINRDELYDRAGLR